MHKDSMFVNVLRIIAVSALILLSGDVFARTCTTNTVVLPDGTFMICQTCCDNSGNCHTTCF